MTQDTWIDLLFSVQAPPNLPRPNGITFDDVRFTEPVLFQSFPPPFGGGLYAILVPDISGRPRTYRAIYFGEAGDLPGRVCKSHERYDDWIAEAGSALRLYVSFHFMTGTQKDRVAVESRLIAKYQPVCNRTFNALGSLFKSLYHI